VSPPWAEKLVEYFASVYGTPIGYGFEDGAPDGM
jgi:hypothetical protein